MTAFSATPATVYDRARGWLHDEGIVPDRAFDNHQTWALTEAHYPGGWAAFTTKGDPA